MMKIQVCLNEMKKKEYANPSEDRDGLDFLAWCLQKADKVLEEGKPLWVAKEIFIQSMKKKPQTSILYGLSPAKYSEILTRISEIRKGTYNATSMVFNGLATDGPILIKIQQLDNALVMQGDKENTTFEPK
ncbi:hypothetical protein [Legionella tucsonensis]|uniref:Uncharacterized protein n=1 Tax=Legionella tucsonensis TaxID=40335 RepID=A0A0W0ZZ66_9GAMM|nr:hypothetical protein [Legionella tucsonensis]KTD74398.1 hypothetical protein Ltuc_2245 [Legionella tucsonensis]